MKKSMKFLALFLGFVVLSMFSGCRLWDEVKNLVGPTNEWLRYDYEYDTGSTKVKLNCYLIYSDGNYKNNDFSDNFKQNYCDSTTGKLKKGLTVVISPKVNGTGSSSSVNDADFAQIFGSAATDKKYVAKTFEDGQSVQMDGENGSTPSFKMGYGAWAIIYNSIELSRTGLPVAVNKDAEFTRLNDNFNWKKFMAVMALQYLLGTEYLE